ncbi:hypothetical protein pb186bvf_008367 [Paramecium bursaria]
MKNQLLNTISSFVRINLILLYDISVILINSNVHVIINFQFFYFYKQRLYIIQNLMIQEPVLAYWGIRGLGQPIRLLLAYLGVKYQDKHYTQWDEWQNDTNPLLNHPFRNLPYYQNGDQIVFESDAIMHYIALTQNRPELLGTDHLSIVKLATWRGVINDFKEFFVSYVYDAENFEKNKEQTIKNVNEWFTIYEKALGDNQFVTGDNITYIDFNLWEMLDEISVFHGETFPKYPKLVAYHKRIAELPAIAEYMNSPHYMKRPFNGETAAFR